MIKKYIYKFFFFLFVFMCFQSASAAELSLSKISSTTKVGDIVKVKVLVSSNQSVNAISGQIDFPRKLLQVQSLSKTGSIIGLWAVEPSYSNSTGGVSLEGVVLNGYKGNGGTVLTITFKVVAAGSGTVQIISGSVLANDGEGTNVLTSKTGFDITTTAGAVEKEPVETTVTPVVEAVVPKIAVEELKKKDEMDPRSRFLITATGIKKTIPYRIEVDGISSVWDDTGTHVFETAPLARGVHTLKVYSESLSGESISGSISFTIKGILTPVITDYSNDIQENDFIVVKGVADPLTTIIVTSTGIVVGNADSVYESVVLKANEKGVFTYVSENRALKGVYMISVKSRTDNGLESETLAPVKITVSGIYNFFKKISNMLSVIIPLGSLLAVFGILLVYAWHKLVSYRRKLKNRLRDTESLVSKSFALLDEDLDQEIKIFKKIKALEPLNDEEKAFIKQFKKDLRAAEKIIVSDIHDSNKVL